MYGVELIYLVQLGYYSLIPLNVICDPFSGLQGLIYSSGVTPIFSMLEQKAIPGNYESLKISSNFLANVNILLAPIFITPFIYFFMKSKADSSKDKH